MEKITYEELIYEEIDNCIKEITIASKYLSEYRENKCFELEKIYKKNIIKISMRLALFLKELKTFENLTK